MYDLSFEIIKYAREWLGTSFKHQGRLKKTLYDNGGCDCIGLIIEISKRFNLKSKTGKLLYHYDTKDYNRFPDKYSLLELMQKHLTEIDRKDLKEADILLFKFDNYPQHVAITSMYSEKQISIIHSYIKAGKVSEHILDKSWNKKIVSAFRFNEMID